MSTSIKLLITAIVSTAVIWPLFLAQPSLAPVLKDPQTLVFINGGDAWKNIYTVAYHTLHDEGLIETQAFNYPDGEHIAFADGQPLLAFFLRLFDVQRVETVYAVVQLLPFLGCIFGAVLLTWLLLRFRLPWLYAILFGVGIALLSPQLTRTTGHFGLSYVFVLPLILHLLVNWTKSKSWVHLGWLLFVTVLVGQLHLYLLASALLLSSSFMLITQVLEWKGSGLKVLTQILTLALVSFVISKGIVDLTWIVVDRPAAPYGLKAFTTPWEDVIIDRSLPWWEWFNSHISKIRNSGGFESKGYVGIVTGLFIVYLLLKYVVARLLFVPFKKTFATPAFQSVSTEEVRKLMLTMCLVSAISFFVASGYWLFIPGSEFVLDRLGAVRQFRSLGRFIWVGYYSIQLVSSVVITFWLMHWAQRAKYRGATVWHLFFRALPVLIASLLIWEGHRSLADIFADPKPQRYNIESWAEGVGEFSAFQAVLPLPYFHVGSENYSPLARYGQAAPSTLFSLRTGLPNMGVMMSRQSGSLTRERLGLNKPWSVIPPVLEKLDPAKPIIIFGQRITMKENAEANSAHDYKPWFAEADTLFIDEDAVLLSFLPSEENLDKVLRNYCETWTQASVLASDIEENVYARALTNTGWELGKDKEGITKSGLEFQELHRWPRPAQKNRLGQAPLMVNWMCFIGGDGYVANTYEVRSTNSVTGETVLVRSVSPGQAAEHYQGVWAQMKVWVPAATAGDELSIWGKMVRHPNVEDITIRNVVTVPSDTSVIWQTAEGIMKDGLLLPACD